MEKLGQLHAEAVATSRRRSGGTSSSSTPRRRGRRSTSSTRRNGSSSLLDGRFMRLHVAPARGPARLLSRGVRARHQRAQQGARRPDPHRRAGVRRRPRHALRRLPAARRGHVLAAAGGRAPRSSWSPRRSPTRCARRPTSSSGSRPRRCRSPASSSTASTSTTSTASPAPTPSRRGRKLASGDTSEQATSELLAVHAERARLSKRETRVAQRFTRGTPGCRPWRSRRCPATCTISTACVEIGELLARTGER